MADAVVENWMPGNARVRPPRNVTLFFGLAQTARAHHRYDDQENPYEDGSTFLPKRDHHLGIAFRYDPDKA